jgi:hypothetical protein
MGAATNQADTRIHAKFTQVKVSVDPQIAAAFKEACASANVSMAAELSSFMTGYSNSMVKSRDTPGYTTRRKRRAIIMRIIMELEQLKAAEERLVDNAPENLQGAPIYETADEYISIFDDVIAQLGVMVP